MYLSKLAYAALMIGILFTSGCANSTAPRRELPDVAPATQPVANLQIDSSQVQPMYQELLAIDLDSVIRIATANNIDIQQARQRVEASRGQREASIGAVFPVIAPMIAYQNVQGVAQNANGTLTNANFNTLFPAVALQWILNPGQVVYDIIASKRRLEASEQQEQSVVLETMRRAAVQYYDLVLAEARLAFARQATDEADELLRLARLRSKAGSGLPADELRAEASLASRQQELILAFNEFYDRSVKLTLTLHLDPVVTLVPSASQIDQVTLVSDELPIENLLAIAAENRPDLEAVRLLQRAAGADKSGAIWGGIGPQVQAGYSYGGIRSHAEGQTFDMSEQHKGTASAGFSFGAETFGHVRTAKADEKLAGLDVQQKLDDIRAAVVSAQQTSNTNGKLIPIARQQVAAAEEALRLTQANFRAGTMLSLDVLQSQNAVDEARFRYADAVVHYNQSQIDLLAALGVLNVEKLSRATATAP